MAVTVVSARHSSRTRFELRSASGKVFVVFSVPAEEQVARLWVAPEASPDATTAST